MAQETPRQKRLCFRLSGPVALLFACALVTSFGPLSSNDTFWHIQAGGEFLATGRVPRTDHFTFTCSGNPWVNHEYLASALFALTERQVGLKGLVLLPGVILFAALLMLFRAARLQTPGRATWCFPALSVAACYGCLPRLMPRPHLFSLLGVAFLTLSLSELRSGRTRLLYATPPLLWLWAQLHGGFLLGAVWIVLLGIYLLFQPGVRHVGCVLLAGPLLLPLGPYGCETFTFPLRLLSARTFMAGIEEWQPLMAGSPLKLPFCYIAAAVLSLGALASLARSAWICKEKRLEFLYFCLLCAAALRMRRALAYPALVATVPLSSLPVCGKIDMKRFSGAFLPALLLLFSIAGIPVGPGEVRPVRDGLGITVPEGACNFLEKLHFRGRCYNSYSFGGYITYRLYPEVKVGIDSRNLVYSESFFTGYQESLRRETPFRTALLAHANLAVLKAPHLPGASAAILTALREDPHWHLVYFDDTAFVFFNHAAYLKLKPQVPEFQALRPEKLAFATSTDRSLKTALTEARRATHLAPRSATAWLLVGRAALARGHKSGAKILLVEAREAFYKALQSPDLSVPPVTYYQLGLLEASLGDRETACFYLRKCLEHLPGLTQARRLLASLVGPGAFTAQK